METQLRLADRRGLLQGKWLSLPQAFAVEILLVLDDKEKAKDFTDRLRVAIGGSHPEMLKTMFPDMFSRTPEEIAKADVEQIDDSEIKWVAPSSQAEVDDLEQWLAENGTSGTFGADELDEWR